MSTPYRERYVFDKSRVMRTAPRKTPLQNDPVESRKTSYQILEEEVQYIVGETERQKRHEQLDRELKMYIIWE